VVPGWFALLLFCSASASGQASRPVVVTDFVIESPDHKSNFTPDAERQVELRIATELARLCQERFGFLKWVPADAAAGGSTPAAQLTLSLKAESGSKFPAIFLEYTAAISGQSHFPGVQKEQLFGGFDDQLTTDHARLERTLFEKLRQQLANDAFRHDLHEGFLQDIPLADTVKLLEPQVIIPVNAEELTASHESVLLVRFSAKLSGTLEKGVVELIPVSEVEGSLSCLIQRLLSPTLVVNQTGGWDPKIAVLLQPPAVESLNVFMLIYKKKPNPGTEGALSTRPE